MKLSVVGICLRSYLNRPRRGVDSSASDDAGPRRAFQQALTDLIDDHWGFYMDVHASAQCFVVGPNGPGDVSYVQIIETATDWEMFGFRIALVPD